MSYRSVVALAAVALLGSCEEVCGCSQPGPAAANITGAVSGNDGNPVPDAIVGANISEAASCGGPAAVYDNGPTTAAGEYSLIVVTQTNGPTVVCFDVFATASGNSPDTAWSRDHSITADLTPPTTRIDLVLTP